jgi:hypothetical protein
MSRTFDIFFVEIQIKAKNLTNSILNLNSPASLVTQSLELEENTVDPNPETKTFQFSQQEEGLPHSPNPDPPPLNSGFIYFGVRLNTELLQLNDFYKQLGLMKKQEIIAAFPQGADIPSIFKISNQNDAAKLSFILEWTFNLIPVNPQKIVFPYNEKYATGIVTANNKTEREIADVLYRARFPLGPRGKTELYRVEPLSIQRKRQKKECSSHLICKIHFFN